jgi:hypothetical protein
LTLARSTGIPEELKFLVESYASAFFVGITSIKLIFEAEFDPIGKKVLVSSRRHGRFSRGF